MEKFYDIIPITIDIDGEDIIGTKVRIFYPDINLTFGQLNFHWDLYDNGGTLLRYGFGFGTIGGEIYNRWDSVDETYIINAIATEVGVSIIWL